jgi:hypothetical protein
MFQKERNTVPRQVLYLVRAMSGNVQKRAATWSRVPAWSGEGSPHVCRQIIRRLSTHARRVTLFGWRRPPRVTPPRFRIGDGRATLDGRASYLKQRTFNADADFRQGFQDGYVRGLAASGELWVYPVVFVLGAVVGVLGAFAWAL